MNKIKKKENTKKKKKKCALICGLKNFNYFVRYGKLLSSKYLFFYFPTLGGNRAKKINFLSARRVMWFILTLRALRHASFSTC